MPKYKNLYTHLQEIGFTLVFKEVTYGSNGKVKGNCDADIVVKAMRDAYENNFDMAVLVSSDGDYASLVSFLAEKKNTYHSFPPRFLKMFNSFETDGGENFLP